MVSFAIQTYHYTICEKVRLHIRASHNTSCCRLRSACLQKRQTCQDKTHVTRTTSHILDTTHIPEWQTRHNYLDGTYVTYVDDTYVRRTWMTDVPG